MSNSLILIQFFLLEIIEAWAKINYQSIDLKNENISKQILWNNSDIINNTFFYKDWTDKGIHFIEHVYDFRTKTFFIFWRISAILQY